MLPPPDGAHNEGDWRLEVGIPRDAPLLPARNSAGDFEGARDGRFAAVADEYFDLAWFDHQVPHFVEEADVARAEAELHRLRFAGFERHPLEAAQAADRLLDRGDRVVDVELDHLIARHTAFVLHVGAHFDHTVLGHRR